LAADARRYVRTVRVQTSAVKAALVLRAEEARAASGVVIGAANPDRNKANYKGKEMMRKIAVPSDDGAVIAAHFGRSASFIVFEIEGGRIVRKELRANNPGPLQHDECHGSGPHGHAHGHNHAGMGETLKDCEAILCRGMGGRAAEALEAFGIEPLMVRTDLSAQDAVEAYLAGSLLTSTQFCRCQH